MPSSVPPRAAARVALVGLTLGLALVAAVEGSLSLLLSYPALARPRPGGVLFAYYMHHDRKIIQFLPACAEYDERLTYRLRTGSCRVVNREHAVDYQVNSMGLRDDEASLVAPEIIVLGDSHAMGWGLGQEETFAQLLERRTGIRVLNAAISSYGTVRELRQLERLDTSRLRHLVIQYGRNDHLENQTYVERGELPISERRVYEEKVAQHARATRYFPGKHLTLMLRLWRTGPPATRERWPGPRRAAVAFLEVLRRAAAPLAGVEVIVFEVNGSARNDSGFVKALARAARRAAEPLPAGRLRTLELSAELGPERYFVLDDHINAAGHQAIAERLFAALVDSPARRRGGQRAK